MFVWTAIYIEKQLEDLRDAVLGIADDNQVRCPLKFLPLHVSLKISFDIPEDRVEECVKALTSRPSSANVYPAACEMAASAAGKSLCLRLKNCMSRLS